jgi:hypothetical protein
MFILSSQKFRFHAARYEYNILIVEMFSDLYVTD